MSGSNGGEPRTDFDLLAERIGEQYDALMAEREPLRARLAELDADLKRLERMLHIARPELKPQAESTPKRKSSGTHKVRASQETLDRIVSFIETNDPSPQRGFSRDVIADQLGLSPSSVSYALRELREQERVRLIGKEVRQPGQMGVAKSLYAVMPNG